MDEIDINKYPRTKMFLQLEIIRQIAEYDYQGIPPTRTSLWRQVNDICLNLLGTEQEPRDYKGV